MGDARGAKSKFWSAQGESSSSESEQNSEPEELEQAPAAPARKDYFSSDEDDMPKRRVVKSRRDRALDELRGSLRSVRAHAKADDVAGLLADYDALTRQLARAAQVGLRRNPPRLFLCAVAELEDWAAAPREGAPAKNANMLKQRLRKGNKAIEAELKAWRASPDLGSEDESKGKAGEEAQDEEDESEEEEEAPKKPAAKKTAAASDDEDEDEDEAEGAKVVKADKGSDEDESDDDEDKEGESDEESGARKWFLKKPKKAEAAARGRRIKVDEESGDEDEEDEDEEDEDEEEEEQEEEDEDKKAERERKEREEREAEEKKELTPEDVARRLGALLAAVGRKKTDTARQIEQLQFLSRKAQQPLQRLQVLVALASAQINAGVVRASSWRACADTVVRVLALLHDEPTLKLDEDDRQASAAAVAAAVSSAGTDLKEADSASAGAGKVAGNVLVMVARLDDDLTRSLQQLDPHSADYAVRMGDEATLLEIMAQAQAHYDALGVQRSAVAIAARRVERLYYRADRSGDGVRLLLREMELKVYAHGEERQRARTALCVVYHDAISDRFYEARDLLLRTHLQEAMNYVDVETQILFNRAIAQLGLSAFRAMLVTEAHSCLADLYAAPTPARELLGQGISPSARFSQEPRDAKQEAAERKRQLPYHMHVNLELVEAAHLISAMLLEAPVMAAAQASSTPASASDSRKRVISRHFRRILDYHERQIFTGPPQNTREVVIAATKALLACDWRKCVELLHGLKVWAVVPNADAVKALLRQRVQEEGLRVFLLSLAQHYTSVRVQRLVEMFELPLTTVHCIAAKMIIGEELHASLDQPTGSLVPQRAEPNRLQSLTLAAVEKASYFVETNERLLDAKTGAYGYKQGPQGQDQGQGSQGQGQGQGQGYYGGYRQGGSGRAQQMMMQMQRGGRGGYRGGRGGYQRGQQQNAQ